MFERIIHRWLRVPYTLHVHYFARPKKLRMTVLLLHGLGTSWQTWEHVADKLPSEYRVVAVDLLGFGDSPKPSWKNYDIKTQARSIALTLMREGIVGPMIIIGHSMGSLIAIELARQGRYVKATSLILCSPPIYRAQVDPQAHPERALRRIYQLIEKNPRDSKRLLRLADRYKLWPDRGFKADSLSAESFLNALSAAIINQNTINDITTLKLPITIISGKLDPLIIEANFKALAKSQPNIHHISMLSQGHEITNFYAKRIAKILTEQNGADRHS